MMPNIRKSWQRTELPERKLRHRPDSRLLINGRAMGAHIATEDAAIQTPFTPFFAAFGRLFLRLFGGLDGVVSGAYYIPPSVSLIFERSTMNCLHPIPKECLALLEQAAETGIGYQIASVELKDGRNFDQVVVSEGCIIEVRGYQEIPFSVDEVVSISVNHNRWNFRDGSDSRRKVRAACA